MAYFLGRDVDLYITTESAHNAGGSDAGTPQAVGVVSNAATLRHTGLTSGNCIPSMASDASVLSGSISDATGIDLSISTSDEDVGPFLGKPQIMQKVELRKETVVTITRKKANNFFDVLYNGPTEAADFAGSGGVSDHRMGARFGVIGDTTDNKYYINDGSSWMYDTVESGATTNCIYGYRVHLVIGNVPDGSANPGQIFTIRNAVMTGHTVTLNADGVTEETIEFTSSVSPTEKTPTNTSANSVPTGFDITRTPIVEL
jgi:hypothetical protein